MESTVIFDPIKEMNEIKNQLSLSKRLGFFFGAGTSMALGIPGISLLTELVISNMNEQEVRQMEQITQELISEGTLNPTIEDMLNKVRLIRQITKESKDKKYAEINGEDAKKLDQALCNSIYDILSEKENLITSGSAFRLKIPQKFFSWLNLLSRDYSKEIFTVNYDLIFEKALERLQLPYFDGFVGAFEPFFNAESVEKGELKEYPPLSWIRIWKLHGSLGWFWKTSEDAKGYQVIRLGSNAKSNDSNELVIYPSREKYESSRKQPFITYFDRLKHHLQNGEGIFIISGYSFADEHINDVIFNGLRQNNRLHIIALMYIDEELLKVADNVSPFLNMSVFSPKKAMIGGNVGEWRIDPENKKIKREEIKGYWDDMRDELLLGDFNTLVDFLADSTGLKKSIDYSEVKNEE
jgi:hypothetical protein